MRDERYDLTGDMATANADRLYRPIVWSLRTTVNEDKAMTVIPYRFNSRDNPAKFQFTICFEKNQLMRLIPEGANVFALPNLAGQAANERDRLSRQIDRKLKVFLAGLTNRNTALGQCLDFFRTDAEIASSLRKAAMLDAFVTMLRKPKSYGELLA
ncbi:hypothetical protein IKE99_00630 [Candidatus Saccharibacteria bacterium]|nr:hypothetical protein [Candidatus Saccharibacteria bacterium]